MGGDDPSSIRILAARQTNLKGERGCRSEARVHGAQPLKAAQHEARRDEQDEGERDLSRHQELPGPMTDAARGGPSADLVQRQGSGPEPHERHRAEGERGHDAQPSRERERDHVETDFFQAWKVGGTPCHQELDAAPRHRQAQRTARDRQQRAFGKKVTRDPSASGTERPPHRDLPLPRLGTNQEQIRNVRAGDEQDHAHGAQQDPQRRRDAANGGVLQRRRCRDQVFVAVARSDGLEGGAQTRQLRAGLGERHPVAQPRDSGEGVRIKLGDRTTVNWC
jgi:hypothetical protein